MKSLEKFEEVTLRVASLFAAILVWVLMVGATGMVFGGVYYAFKVMGAK